MFSIGNFGRCENSVTVFPANEFLLNVPQDICYCLFYLRFFVLTSPSWHPLQGIRCWIIALQKNSFKNDPSLPSDISMPLREYQIHYINHYTLNKAIDTSIVTFHLKKFLKSK